MTITLQIQMDVWKPHGASFTSFCSRVKIHPLLTDIRSCSSNCLSSHKNCLSVLWEDPRPPETARLHLLSTINSFFPEQSRPFLLPPNYDIIFLNWEKLPELFCLFQAACQDTSEARGSYRPLQVTSPSHPTLTWQFLTEWFSLLCRIKLTGEQHDCSRTHSPNMSDYLIRKKKE